MRRRERSLGKVDLTTAGVGRKAPCAVSGPEMEPLEGSKPENPSRREAPFWKDSASTCAQSLRAELEGPCLRFCFLALKMLFALGININKLGLIFSVSSWRKKKTEQSCN